jgi:hypothetical protein
MGARFRLKAGFDISHFRPDTQVILRAMQRHGLIIADNGSNWFFGGASEPGWPDGLISELKTVAAGNFEAVDESSLMIDAGSGRARATGAPGPVPVPIVKKPTTTRPAPPPPSTTTSSSSSTSTTTTTVTTTTRVAPTSTTANGGAILAAGHHDTRERSTVVIVLLISGIALTTGAIVFAIARERRLARRRSA